MPAGLKYDLNPMEVLPEMCDVKSIYRRSGGFNLDVTNVTAGAVIPPLAPLAVDFATRKATAVRNVQVALASDASATAINVKKNSLAAIGMFLSDGTKSAQVTAIDKSNPNYDAVTISLGAATAVGAILFEVTNGSATTPLRTANNLNYAAVKVEQGATVTVIGAVMEIHEAKLVAPVSAKDKETLGARFDFVI